MLFLKNFAPSKISTILIGLCFLASSSLALGHIVEPLQGLIEEVGVSRGDYVIPNEHDPLRFQHAIQGKTDTLISVGTFRSLFALNMGNFSRVILLDYDQVATEFNRIHLKWIQALTTTGMPLSTQRYQYLAHLYGCQIEEAEIIRAAGDHPNELIKVQTLLAALYSLVEQEDPRCGSLFQTLSPALTRALKVYRLHEALQAISEIELTKHQTVTYWSSNRAWHHLQTMIAQNRITILNGSLTGTETMTSLGRELSRIQENVSVLDLSNCLDYVDLHKLHDNIQALPLRDDAMILFTLDSITTDPRFHGTGDDYWNYFGLNFIHFLENSTSFSHLVKYLKFIYHI